MIILTVLWIIFQAAVMLAIQVSKNQRMFQAQAWHVALKGQYDMWSRHFLFTSPCYNVKLL